MSERGLSTPSPRAEDSAFAVLVFGGVAVAVGVLAYFGYNLVQNVFGGANCTTPGSACYSALAGYQEELQACTNEFTQLMATIAQQGSAPTPAQQTTIDQLKSCMDTAAAKEAQVAASFNNSVYNTAVSLLTLVVEGAIVFYGLKGMGNWIVQNKGKFKTQPADGASAAAYLENATIQYALQESLITSSIASAWTSAVQGFTTDNVADTQAYWSALAAQQIVTQQDASSISNLLEASMSEDEGATIAELAAAPP